MTFWKVVPGIEIWLVSGLPTVPASAPTPMSSDEPDGQRAPGVGGAPAAEAVQEGGHGGLLEDGGEVRRMRAATVARWGSRPVRTWPIAAAKQSRSEVRAVDGVGCRGADASASGGGERAQPRPGTPPRRRRRGWRRSVATRRSEAPVPQPPAQPALEPVEPGVQLDEDQAAGVGGGLAGGGEHADPLEEVDRRPGR